MRAISLLAVLACLSAGQAAANKVDVLKADVECADGTCRFSVTLEHADEGWNHYADKWEVVAPDGEVIAVRELAHPHVNEQPFTRSLGNVAIPKGVTTVTIRAHDSVHGYGNNELKVALPL